ncbi:TIGR02452 family protein [Bacteroides sp. 214]|uniref:TIGR02452 family protein n=1 Tax=Bacteroides sp. 214 TaxID=2302935 RepID=UPI0013D37996|nr:TIGR02452 family protein [Bacteroides sp. 214]NDW12020.1 TIGR02452 family protein [Bacteroides sp. 214]
MAIAAIFINLIIPIENIQKHYPGGFKQYKRDNGNDMAHDCFLVVRGAMNAMDIESYAKECETFGLVGVVEKEGIKQWQDFCVVEVEPTLPCDWLLQSGAYVYHKDDVAQKIVSSFSPTEWIKQFRTASRNKSGFRELRAEIFQQTVEVALQGEYAYGWSSIKLDSASTTKETYFYTKPKALEPIESDSPTKFSVIEADCLETAGLLKNAGYNVCVLNMASRQNPGGGVLNGAGAQEENIFRRSNLFQSLYQFVDYSYQYDVERNRENSYPLDRESGGIYSKKVSIIRGSENNGYCFLQSPFEVSVVSVPAINHPQLETFDGKQYIVSELIEPSKEKIRTILRICGEFNHDCLVLSAFGCGAFKNPPHHVAKLFKQVFKEDEFKNRFKLVVFAIIDDHNSWREHNPEGNILPFLREFETNFD